MDDDPTAVPAALAARWRADAQVFRRYGSPGRARMLERMADELEQCTAQEAAMLVDLSAAAALSGFTRGHLRRLYRDGRLVAAAVRDTEPLFRISDLPRKPGRTAAASDRPGGAPHAQIARDVIGSRHPHRRSRAA